MRVVAEASIIVHCILFHLIGMEQVTGTSPAASCFQFSLFLEPQYLFTSKEQLFGVILYLYYTMTISYFTKLIHCSTYAFHGAIHDNEKTFIKGITLR